MYADYEFYRTEYVGGPITCDSFRRFSARAEDAINALTRYRIDMAKLPPHAQDLVKRAVCAQVEYYNEYGIETALAGREDSGGFTVGRVSVTGGKKEGGSASMVCPQATMLLEQTGLLSPAVPIAYDMGGFVW